MEKWYSKGGKGTRWVERQREENKENLPWSLAWWGGTASDWRGGGGKGGAGGEGERR